MTIELYMIAEFEALIFKSCQKAFAQGNTEGYIIFLTCSIVSKGCVAESIMQQKSPKSNSGAERSRW